MPNRAPRALQCAAENESYVDGAEVGPGLVGSPFDPFWFRGLCLPLPVTRASRSARVSVLGDGSWPASRPWRVHFGLGVKKKTERYNHAIRASALLGELRKRLTGSTVRMWSLFLLSQCSELSFRTWPDPGGYPHFVPVLSRSLTTFLHISTRSQYKKQRDVWRTLFRVRSLSVATHPSEPV